MVIKVGAGSIDARKYLSSMNIYLHNLLVMEVKNHMDDLMKSFKSKKKYKDEEFKFLTYPGVNPYMYVISNYGRVFNFSKEKELKFHIDKDGYRRIGIIRNINEKRTKSPIGIHRMVAYTFVERIDETLNLVNHKDGIKENNYYKNLEWSNPGENTRHAIKMGLQTNSGPNAPNAVYSEDLVRVICKKLESGLDCKEIYTLITGDDKIEDRAVYALIFSIKSGKRHKDISSEYDIPMSIISKTRPKFTQREVEQITKMILDGCSTTTIIKFFGGKSSKDKKGKRIFDKIQQIKKRIDMTSTTRES